MPLHTIILAGAVIFAGVVLQGAVGFGLGLFCIPILLYLGVDLYIAVAILTVATMAQSIYGAISYRDHIPWLAVRQTVVWRFVFAVIGVVLLWYIDSLPRDTIKQIVGVAVLLVLIAQQSLRIQPHHQVHIGWAALAGSLSGLMAGALGMGGPPIVLWAMAHDWPSRTTRSFFWTSFGLLAPVTIVAMLFTFGWPVVHGLLIGLAVTPLTLVGVRIGIRIGERLNRQRLRLVMVVLLVIIAVTAIVGPLVSHSPAKTSPANPSPGTIPSTGPGDSPAQP